MATQERDPRAYELMTVFIPDLTDEDSQSELEKIEGQIAANGGTMTETLTASPWGRRRLAYTIRFNGVDYRDGIYTVLRFNMVPSALANLERELKLDTNLMRYLLVHDDPKAHEQVREEEEAEGEESEAAPTTAAAGQAAGSATATAAAAASETESDTAESPAQASEPTETPAAESAPVEEAAAPETVTDTAPPAADSAASDDDKE